MENLFEGELTPDNVGDKVQNLMDWMAGGWKKDLGTIAGVEFGEKDKKFRFKTVEEAEEYFMGKYAYTNNMHGEEDERLERWLSEQDIEETKGQ